MPTITAFVLSQANGPVAESFIPLWPLLLVLLGAAELFLSEVFRGRFSGLALILLGTVLLPVELGYPREVMSSFWPYSVVAEHFWNTVSLLVTYSVPIAAHWLKFWRFGFMVAAVFLVVTQRWGHVRSFSAADRIGGKLGR